MPRNARRAQLLESALEVFVAQGYHAAAMDDIADRAGVSKPVLYQHFPGKLDLYLALLDRATDAVIEGTRAALESTDDNKQRVAATMHAFYTYVASEEGEFRLVFESDLTNEPAVRERIDRVTTECADMIAHVIHDDTGLPNEQSRLLAVALVGMGEVSARSGCRIVCPALSTSSRTSRPVWSRASPGAASADIPAPTNPTDPNSTDHRTTSGGPPHGGQDRRHPRQPRAHRRHRPRRERDRGTGADGVGRQQPAVAGRRQGTTRGGAGREAGL